MLKIENLDVYYGEALAIKDISLEVAEGEIVAVLGANGAGKSTLVNAIAGVIPAKNGSITLDGQSLNTVAPHQVVTQGVALVPEGRRLFTKLTVEQNLDLGAFTLKDADQAAELKENVFNLFPILRERSEQIAGTLSGGQQQMVAIGRALMAAPRYLLMDEPSLGLAPIIVEDMFDLIQQIHSSGVSVLIVEQNVERTLEISDRGYVLEDGKIVMSGTRKELLNSKRIQEAYLALN